MIYFDISQWLAYYDPTIIPNANTATTHVPNLHKISSLKDFDPTISMLNSGCVWYCTNKQILKKLSTFVLDYDPKEVSKNFETSWIFYFYQASKFPYPFRLNRLIVKKCSSYLVSAFLILFPTIQHLELLCPKFKWRDVVKWKKLHRIQSIEIDLTQDSSLSPSQKKIIKKQEIKIKQKVHLKYPHIKIKGGVPEKKEPKNPTWNQKKYFSK